MYSASLSTGFLPWEVCAKASSSSGSFMRQPEVSVSEERLACNFSARSEVVMTDALVRVVHECSISSILNS